ncbi:hypothetical protein [Leucobacter soli]|uniref:hypothetical protein n=1 Tax=Leucobacter soli TaxID=2812850 RepID=UPI0036148570
MGDHADRRRRELAGEDALHERDLRRGIAQLAAEAQLELVAAVDRRGRREQLVGQAVIGDRFGAQAELLDAADQLIGVRPVLLDRGDEYRTSAGRDAAEEALDQAALRRSRGGGIAEGAQQGRRSGDLSGGAQQFGACRLAESAAQSRLRRGQSLA